MIKKEDTMPPKKQNLQEIKISVTPYVMRYVAAAVAAEGRYADTRFGPAALEFLGWLFSDKRATFKYMDFSGSRLIPFGSCVGKCVE